MEKSHIQILKPGMLGGSADSRRDEFDLSNEILLVHNVAVDFIFIGDSITHLWDVNGYFGRIGLTIVNRGIGGDITTHALQRFDADVIQLKPRCVVIKIGINNLWALDGVLEGWWTQDGIKSPHEIIDGIVRDITSMTKKAKNVGITPVICSILPTNMPSSGYDDTLRNKSIRIANGKLLEMTVQEDAIYVNYHTHLLSADGCRLNDSMADDGIHPNVFGYDIMAEILRKTLLLHQIVI